MEILQQLPTNLSSSANFTEAINSFMEVKQMDTIYDHLDEVKVEGKKLREESQVKLRAKTQPEKLEFDKLAKELRAMSEEIYELRKMYDKVQSGIHRKELLFNQTSSVNEKPEADYNEKILKLEGENRVLVLSLDEAFARIRDVEKKTAASSEEISGLKRLLSIKQQLNSEMQKNASTDLKERDGYILKLEEECRISQDQLKWKNEQFCQLEEAHRKLQTLLQASKLEWQKEKSSLLDEISSLQGTLDSQNSASEILESQLKMSNQALSHEESRRKVLEIEVLESRSKFENAFLKCQVEESEIDQSTMKREYEIAELRNLVRKYEILAHEMNCKNQQLEQENYDLLVSLKSNHDVRVNRNAASSTLEQLNGDCIINLAEEAEWNSQIEKLRRDTRFCSSQLAEKNRGIRELHKELEEYQSLLEVQNNEILDSITVLKSELYVAYSKLHDTKEELEQRSDEVAVLVERVELLESLNQKDNLMEEELKSYKGMLDESKQCQSHLKQQFIELENAHAENIKNAVARVNIELQNKTSEIEAVKFELHKSESGVEILKLNLEDNQQAHEQEKTSLLVTVNDKDDKIVTLEQHISMLKSVIFEKSEAADQEMTTISQEKSLLQSMQMALQPEETNKSEIQELRSQLEMETRCFENLLEELKSHKHALLEDQREEKIKKENLLAQLEFLFQQIGLLCTEDVELMSMLGKLSHPYEEGSESARNVVSSDGVSNTFSLSRKSVQVNLDERVPLTELNVNSIWILES